MAKFAGNTGDRLELRSAALRGIMALNTSAFALDTLHPHFTGDLHGRGPAMQIFERLIMVRLFPSREFLFVTISA